jgi:RNA polymerase sigma factor (sigma-70 family)
MEDALDRLLGQLTPEENQCVRLRYIDGLRLNEIAQPVGIAYRTVRSRIKRGLKVLCLRLTAAQCRGRPCPRLSATT